MEEKNENDFALVFSMSNLHSFVFPVLHTAVPCENVSSGICGQRRPWSACAFAQSDQGLHCPLTESLDTIECMNGEQRPGWYLAHSQDGLNLRISRMFEGSFAWRGPVDVYEFPEITVMTQGLKNSAVPESVRPDQSFTSRYANLHYNEQRWPVSDSSEA